MRPLGPPRNAWHVDDHCADLVRRRPAPRPLALPARPQSLVVDLERCALVVVDLQRDFCSPDGWLTSVVGVDAAANKAVATDVARLVDAVRPAGVPVVWCNWGNRPDRANVPPGVAHVYSPDGRQVGLGDPLPGGAGRVLERASPSAGLVEPLVPAPGDLWVDKYRMSGFFDTELDAVLRNLDVTTLLFAGVNVDQCVYATLCDAAGLGYDCVLLDDCCATTSPSFCVEATRYNVAQCYGFVADGADLVAALARTAAPVATPVATPVAAGVAAGVAAPVAAG